MAVNPLKDELYVTNALDPRDGNTNGSLSRVDLTAHKENAVLKGLKFPKGVVVSEDGKTIFLLQKEVGLLTVISAQEMKILDNLKVGSRPDLLAILKGKLYIAESKTGLVHVVEITDSTPGKIKLKYLKEVMVGSNPVSLTTVPERRMVLVANQNSGTVSVIDGATDQVSAVIPIGKSPKGIWAAKDYAYVVDEMGTLLMLSLEEMAQMKCTRLCQMISPNDPAHIAVSPNKQKVMVVGYNTGVITIFDFNGGEK